MNIRSDTLPISIWWLPATAGLLVLVMNFWCQIHGSVLGEGPVDPRISLPWAMKIASGWILAAALLSWAGPRWLDAPRIRERPWATRVALTTGVVLATLLCERWLVGPESALGPWLYDRLPPHAAFATLLVIGFMRLRERRCTHPDIAAPTASAPPVATAAEQTRDPPEVVEVMTGTGRTQVRIADIECLEADRNYIVVHTGQRSYLLRQTLTAVEKSLSGANFQRVHRSTIVNRDKIRERRRGGVLVLSSGRTVRISRAFADRVH